MIIDLPSVYSEWHPVAPIDLANAEPDTARPPVDPWPARLEQAEQALAEVAQDERRAFAAAYCRQFGL